MSDDEKKTKEEVSYSDGKPGERCGLCVHFVPTDRCELVAGDIRPSAWCKLFEKREYEDAA